MTSLLNHAIRRALVVDDDKDLREQYGDHLSDLGIEPIYADTPLQSVEDSLDQWRSKVDALVCDYRLKIRNFAQFNGDHLVATFNRNGLPAILCTTYADSEMMVLRSKRRYIPVLLQADTYNTDRIQWGFNRCQREYAGDFDPSRKPWRTLVRVTDTDEGNYFHVVVPAWNPELKLRVYHQDVPPELHAKIRPDQRLHAQVNTGAEDELDLYFDEWEGD